MAASARGFLSTDRISGAQSIIESARLTSLTAPSEAGSGDFTYLVSPSRGHPFTKSSKPSGQLLSNRGGPTVPEHEYRASPPRPSNLQNAPSLASDEPKEPPGSWIASGAYLPVQATAPPGGTSPSHDPHELRVAATSDTELARDAAYLNVTVVNRAGAWNPPKVGDNAEASLRPATLTLRSRVILKRN